MQDIKQRVALGSIVASAGLTLAKAIVGLTSGSLAMLSEAAHSLIDVAATVMTFFAVRIGAKPADEKHQYGHGKVESVFALAETALLFVLSAVVVFEALRRLMGSDDHAVQATLAAFAVIIGSIVVDFMRARVLYRVARQTSSEALEADALHFSSDMWSSIAVLGGLIAVAAGYPSADAIAALAVAVFICIAAWRLGRRTIDTLTDTAPAGSAERIRQVVQRIDGVIALERVRARAVGPVLFVDLAVTVNRGAPLERVAALKDRITSAVQGEFPQAEITLTTTPRALDDETVLEQVMAIARNRGLAVHHVTVHAIEDRLSISLDLEVDGSLTLGAAHDVASRLEDAIRAELGPRVEVETHIEPLQLQGSVGREADAVRAAEVHGALERLAAEVGLVGDVHDVRVRKTEEGELVNFHCQVDPGVPVQQVHEKVDALERQLRRVFPSIKRVIGHAEPRTARRPG